MAPPARSNGPRSSSSASSAAARELPARDLPPPSRDWSVAQVGSWLRQNLPSSVTVFASNEISGEVLFLLDEEDLEYELDIKSTQHRRAIMGAVGRSRALHAAAAAATATAASQAAAAVAAAAAAPPATPAPAPAPAVPTRGAPSRPAEPINGVASFAAANGLARTPGCAAAPAETRPAAIPAAATTPAAAFAAAAPPEPAPQQLMLACHLSNKAVQIQVERAQAELASMFPATLPISPSQLFLPLAQLVYTPTGGAAAQAAMQRAAQKASSHLNECCARAQQVLNAAGTPTNAHLLGVHFLPPVAHAPHIVPIGIGIPQGVCERLQAAAMALQNDFSSRGIPCNARFRPSVVILQVNCADAAAASNLYSNSASLGSLRARSFGSQRFDAFSLLCLQPELAPSDTTPAEAMAAAQQGAVRDPNDPWSGVPTSVSLQLIPSSATSVTLRAVRAGTVA